MKEKSSDIVEYLSYWFRWNFLPAFIIIGGIYIIGNSNKRLVYLIAFVGIFSLALWANHDRPKSYNDYLKNKE